MGAGITILPRPGDVVEEKPTEDVTMLEPEEALQWPLKPGIPRTDLFDPDDSWFDAPPDGFSLTVRVIHLMAFASDFSLCKIFA